MSKLIKTIILTSSLIFGLSNANTVENVLKNSYKVYSYGQKSGPGSGFVSDKLKDYIITNKHVILNGNVFQVSGLDLKKKYAKLVYSSAKYDIAILKLEHEKLITNGIQHCETSKVTVGQPVYNFGNPNGLDFIFTKGYISGFPRKLTKENLNYLIHSLIGFSGQSGSALLKSDSSCLLGIVTAGIMPAEIGFSIPIEILDEVINDFLKNKDNLLDMKTIEVKDSSEVTIILSDFTFYDQEKNILYLKRTEKNYKLMLTSLIVLLILLYIRRKQNEKIK